MTRLLIVSRSMALAMRLSDQFDVTEHPADDLEGLLPNLDADLLVLDVGDAVLAVNTVNALREAGQDIPVLLVSGYQPEWEQVEAQQVEGVHVVPLPITRSTLLVGIAELIGEESPRTPLGGWGMEASWQQDDGRSAVSPPPGPAATLPATFTSAGGAPGTPVAEVAAPVGAGGRVSPDVTADAPGGGDGTGGAVAHHPADAVPGIAGDVTEPVGGGVGQGHDVQGSQNWDSDLDDTSDQDVTDQQDRDATDQDDQDVTDHEDQDQDEARDDRDQGSQNGNRPDGDTESRDSGRPGTEEGPDARPGGSLEELDWSGLIAGTILPSHDRGGPAGGSGVPTDPIPVMPAAATEVTYPTSDPYDEEPFGAPVPAVDPGTRLPFSPPRWLRGSTPAGGNPQPELREGSHRMPRLGNRPRKLQRPVADPRLTPAARATSNGRAPVPAGLPTDPHRYSGSDLDRRLDAEAAALVNRRSAGGDPGMALRTADLVRMLHDRAGDLYGVSDTAQVLADDVIERADADAAAVLVPDGPVWRVSGGVGLRPLERRLVLEDSHWLITEIGSAGRAVLIEDTDIIRQELAGAPLAAWRHLLAVPVPDVRAIVVLARGQEAGPFTDHDLSVVIAPVREASTLLVMAVETRRLARMLSPLREQDAEGIRPRRPL